MDLEPFLEDLKDKALRGDYATKSHVLLHAFEEGFEEGHILQAIVSARILEYYPEEMRCLLCGSALYRLNETAS